MEKYLYIRVSPDKLELPEAVAESPAQLARMLGVKRQSISRAITKGKHGANTIYKKVRIDNE